MKLFIALILILSLFYLGRLSAQPKTLDDLVEFRADGVYAKETFRMTLPYWPQYIIHKNSKICEIINE